jgi:hypothetical protein
MSGGLSTCMDNRPMCVVSGSGLASSSPVVGKGFGQAGVRVRVDAFEEVAQVGEGIDA